MIAAVLRSIIEPSNRRTVEPPNWRRFSPSCGGSRRPDLSLDIVLSCIEPGDRTVVIALRCVLWRRYVGMAMLGEEDSAATDE